MINHITPEIDADSAPFWQAAREHRLSIQYCEGCSRYQFPPRPVCATCRKPVDTWRTVSGQGHIVSWTKTHHVTHPVFVAQLPFCVLFVELAEQPGLTMYGNVRPIDTEIKAGMPVTATFEDVSPTLTLVQWTPARGHA
jgi:uncharacterized protein